MNTPAHDTPPHDTPPHDDTATSAPSAARRRWLFASVAGAAAVAGAGLSWWQSRLGGGPTREALSFWAMDFPTPGADKLAMRTFFGNPLLLNFWATWCPPCIEEMPLLDRFHEQNSGNGWQVLGMAVDQEPAVRRFLAQTPVRFPITLAGMAGVELSRALGNQGGGLPFTVLFDRKGRIVQRKMGRVSPQDLQDWHALR